MVTAADGALLGDAVELGLHPDIDWDVPDRRQKCVEPEFVAYRDRAVLGAALGPEGVQNSNR